jgi:hypothetical protein
LLAKFGAKMTSLLAIYTMKWFKRNCTYPVRWRGLPWRQTSLGGRYHGDRWSWWRTSTLNPTWNPTWNLNGRYWRAQKALLTCQYHSDSCRKIVLIGQFVSHGYEWDDRKTNVKVEFGIFCTGSKLFDWKTSWLSPWWDQGTAA